MPHVESFLAENGLRVSEIDAEALLQSFDAEMTRGLAGAPDALPMIPAYLTVDRPVPLDTPVAVIDAGGTNLRVATVRFDAQGKPHIEDYARHRMPGTQGELSAAAFYEALADVAAPVARRARAVGFCFSYPAEVTPDCDARLLRWTKQVQAPEVVGTRVGSALRECLARRDCDRRIVVLNDTVATLLAGKSAGVARRYGSYVGFILGTGTNTAYVEGHANIRKCPALDPRRTMVINVESGSFSKAPQSRFDRLFDEGTADRGAYTFEKMIAGAYLGGLGSTILREGAKAGLFSPGAAGAIAAMPPLSSPDLDRFILNPHQPSTAFAALPLTDDDRRTALALCLPVYTRAALFTAVAIAAAAIRSGAGADPLHPVAITIDGSTYYRTGAASFASRVQEHLRAILGPRRIHVDLLHVDEAPLIGAAVAGLTAAL